MAVLPCSVERIFQQASKYSNTLLRCLNVSSYTSKWLMPVHEIFLEYGMKAAQNYIQLVTDEHLQSYMTRKFKDIAIQSWHSKLSNSKLTHRYAFCKNEFKLEQCLNRLLPATQIKLGFDVLYMHCQQCPFCKCACTPDEYHYVMKCVTLDNARMSFLPRFTKNSKHPYFAKFSEY